MGDWGGFDSFHWSVKCPGKAAFLKTNSSGSAHCRGSYALQYGPTLGVTHNFPAPKDPSGFAVFAQNPELVLVGVRPTPDGFGKSGDNLLVVA